MRRSTGKNRGLIAALIVGMAVAGLGAPRPAVAQDCTNIPPYVFILLDTSGSMSWAPPCSQAEIDAGYCAWRCDPYDCWVPQMADSPSSKFYQVKEALYDVISRTGGMQLGFATFNQDALGVRSKHWLYEAAGNGVSIPGWGAFPSAGTDEVFGSLWNCNTGSGNNQTGCGVTFPAYLSDSWQRTRVQQLPKLGTNFNQAVTFYVRSGGMTFKVTYTPVAGATPGSPVDVTEKVLKCGNGTCSLTTLIGQTVVSFNPISDFLAWDNGDSSSSLNQTNPELSYFSASLADDAYTSNSCTGWESNTDSPSDLFSGYNLKWPTTTDLRGTSFSFGDMIPQDWLDQHDGDVLARLSPSPLPDFRTATYLNDRPVLGETFLRLKDAGQRPLIASGSSPLGASVNAFRKWWSGCATGVCNSGWALQAAIHDPDWLCRRQYLIVLSDGDETCNGTLDACSEAAALYTHYGIKTYAVGFGAGPKIGQAGNKLSCLASAGGTGGPFIPYLLTDLKGKLTAIFTDIRSGS